MRGGHSKNPTYQEVCTGTSGHAEVCQIEFDPRLISYTELLEVFWKTHDPTSLNRQGNDIGTQYRSIIFYHDEEQKKLALESRKKIGKIRCLCFASHRNTNRSLRARKKRILSGRRVPSKLLPPTTPANPIVFL